MKKMKFAPGMLLLPLLAIGLSAVPAFAADRSGKEVVETVCLGCHATGVLLVPVSLPALLSLY